MPHVQSPGFQPHSATLGGATPGKDHALQRSIRGSVSDALASEFGIDANGRGIAGLAVAIRDKLRTMEGKAEAVPAVLETINRALDDAATKLAAKGVSQEQIDEGLARFRHKLSRELGELVGVADSPARSTDATGKSAIAAREVVRERFSLDVLTAEGDTVSIRFMSLNVTDVAAAQFTRDGVTATTVEASVISRGRFKVEVGGDLNEAERTAIANLLDTVDDIAADFFGGDVQAAFAAAARAGLDSEALSAFDLKLSYSRSHAAAQAYASNAKPGTQPASAPAPADPTPVSVTPVEPVTLPAETQAPTASPVADTRAPIVDAAPASEGTATTAAAAATASKATTARETIATFAKEVLERLDKDDETNATKFSLRWKVEFLIKAFGSVALTQIEQKAADALGISLEARTPAI